MKIEINLRLDVIGRRNSLADNNERAFQAIRFLWKHFGDVRVDRQSEQVERTHFTELQDRLVLSLYSQHDRWLSEHYLVQLSDLLDQECVAVYYPEFHRGRVIGSRPEAWGNFDYNKFERINQELGVTELPSKPTNKESKHHVI